MSSIGRIVHVSPQDPNRFFFGFYFAAVVLLSLHCNWFGLFAPTRADKVYEEFKAQISEKFARNNEEKDAAEKIHREDEV
ncbi:hypothetical protein PHMEG_00036060 [Phytophthora megakarya]|uniref:Transmembrane protein n=1 Tax=Phytophthora megakarya TaxID=4795 RepID=A0A225UMW1_9STRA|nr:hypothetical protein PHMEG_00036060 [Phytophthora megakarya]